MANKPILEPRFRKTIYLLPNLFTAANMILGILAIAMSFNDALTLRLSLDAKELPFVWPARLIIIAIFLDFMDGWVARATGTTSKFGLEFDSMADLISFGMAPAILIYLSVLRYLPFWGLSIAVLYVLCTALRLARFNVQAEVEEKKHFVGLPSPAAAGMLVSYVLLSRWGGWYGKGVILNKMMGWYEENINQVELWIIPALTVLIALLMVSTIHYPSLKKFSRERIKLVTLVAAALVVFFAFYAAEFTVFVVLLVYVIGGFARDVMKNGLERMRNKRKASGA